MFLEKRKEPLFLQIHGLIYNGGRIDPFALAASKQDFRPLLPEPAALFSVIMYLGKIKKKSLLPSISPFQHVSLFSMSLFFLLIGFSEKKARVLLLEKEPLRANR